MYYNLSKFLPQISNSTKQIPGAAMARSELEDVTKLTKSNKTPGPDGYSNVPLLRVIGMIITTIILISKPSPLSF